MYGQAELSAFYTTKHLQILHTFSSLGAASWIVQLLLSDCDIPVIIFCFPIIFQLSSSSGEGNAYLCIAIICQHFYLSPPSSITIVPLDRLHTRLANVLSASTTQPSSFDVKPLLFIYSLARHLANPKQEVILLNLSFILA